MQTNPVTQYRPFHETVINLIWATPVNMMVDLAEFLRSTSIPGNHDAIIAAWEKQRHSFEALQDEDFGVPASIQEQKAHAEAKTASKAAAITFVQNGPILAR